MGVDTLLTTSFGGGSISGSISSVAGIGPVPKTDTELGLVVMGDETPTVWSLVVQAQVIKEDTQKADCAAMPDHLRIYTFLCGYGLDVHGPEHLRALGLAPMASIGGLSNSSPPEGWEVTASGLSTLALFRLLALHHWRQQVLCGFFAWWRHNVQITKGCSPGHMVRSLLNSRGGKGGISFGWSPKGEVDYKAQWDFIWSKPDGRATIRAGHNAIWQSAHTSWFEWLEGSAPFFWNWSEPYQREICNGQQHF